MRNFGPVWIGRCEPAALAAPAPVTERQAKTRCTCSSPPDPSTPGAPKAEETEPKPWDATLQSSGLLPFRLKTNSGFDRSRARRSNSRAPGRRSFSCPFVLQRAVCRAQDRSRPFWKGQIHASLPSMTLQAFAPNSFLNRAASLQGIPQLQPSGPADPRPWRRSSASNARPALDFEGSLDK